MSEYEQRRNAREIVARDYKQTLERKGQQPSFEQCQRIVNERADLVDKKKDNGGK